jgi:hypothetical protein
VTLALYSEIYKEKMQLPVAADKNVNSGIISACTSNILSLNGPESIDLTLYTVFNVY